MIVSAQTVHLRIEGPPHEIHREMLANAQKRSTAGVVVEAAGLETALEVERRLGPAAGVVFVDAPQQRDEGVEYVPTVRERIVAAALDPNLAFVTLAIGMLLIFVEFCHPGLVAPGALGGVLAMVSIYGLSASAIRWQGVALLVASAALFSISAFVPSRGMVGLTASAAMLAGALLLIGGAPAYRIRPLVALGVTVPFALITLFLTSAALRGRTNKLSEQIQPVVFASSNDIFSTISGESGQGSGRASSGVTHGMPPDRT